jgi:hypothetical protein
MSKYFTDDNDLSALTEQVQESTKIDNITIPTQTNNNTSQYSQINQQKPTPRPTTVEEHIAAINIQNNEVNKSMEEITKQTGDKISNTFETLAPLELFERMNQLTYLIVKMNNKLTAIEELLVLSKNNKSSVMDIPKEIVKEKLSPKEQYIQENSQELTPLEAAQQQLRQGMESHGNGLPVEGYTDESNNLENIFPNMPTEAYQAAYQGMNDENAMKSGGKGIVF